jgi:excinuclease UvrABC nuclease subunit
VSLVAVDGDSGLWNAMVDVKDAPNITIPIFSIASKDEDKSAMDQYEAALEVPNQTEWYHDQIHGFMAARSNLDDENAKAAYEKAY